MKGKRVFVWPKKIALIPIVTAWSKITAAFRKATKLTVAVTAPKPAHRVNQKNVSAAIPTVTRRAVVPKGRAGFPLTDFIHMHTAPAPMKY
jgi:hypothetical protein